MPSFSAFSAAIVYRLRAWLSPAKARIRFSFVLLSEKLTAMVHPPFYRKVYAMAEKIYRFDSASCRNFCVISVESDQASCHAVGEGRDFSSRTSRKVHCLA